MTTLALDLAGKVGWACSDGKSGMMDLRPFESDLGRMGWALWEWLSGHFSRHQVSRLVLERPFYRGGGVHVYKLNGLAFLAQAVAFEWQLERAEWAAPTVRSALGIQPIGSDKHKWKRGVLAWAEAQGFEPETDDEADALALLSYDMEHAAREAAA